MPTVGVYLIYTAVVLRAVVVVSLRTELPAVMVLLAGYGLLLIGETWLRHRNPSRYLRHPKTGLLYLFLQSVLVIGVLIVSSYEDFLAMLFIPLSLDAVVLFGRRAGFASIAVFSLAMVVTLLFSNVGPLFGLVMGILYSGVCFLVGGYAYQVQNARTVRDHNESLLNKLQIAHRQLQVYAAQMESLAVEHERNRLARELHDSVTQTVFSMNLAAQSAHLVWEKEPQRVITQLLRIEELAASALREIQSLVSQLRLRSIFKEGLPAALGRLAAEQKARNGLQVTLEIHGERALPEKTASTLYFITHEALTNVSKHSGVCETIVRLNLAGDHACLEIEDHGRGFQSEATPNQRGHLGLAGMSERAREIGWNLSIQSRPGQGTRVLVTEKLPGAVE
jgi:signal transduction histidine kinase